MAAQQLVLDIAQIEAEQWDLIQVEVDPVLLLSDKQLKAEVEKLTSEEKVKFNDYSCFAEDWHVETGKYESIDHVVKHLVKVRYPGIPPVVASLLVQSEDQPEEGAIEVPTFTESSSNKALLTAIFLSSDPAILSYNLKGKAAEREGDDYESIGSESDEGELDSTQMAQIWHDMAKLKRDEAALYDKLAKAAPTMTQGDLLYSVEKTPHPTTQLPECAEEMYTHIDNPARFTVALAAAERLMNIY